MPKVTFLPAAQSFEFVCGQLTFRGEGLRGSLLDIALNLNTRQTSADGQINLRHLCAGLCACTTCHVIVEQGGELLSAVHPEEQDRLTRVPNVTPRSRLACQAVVHNGGAHEGAAEAEVVVRIPSRPPANQADGPGEENPAPRGPLDAATNATASPGSGSRVIPMFGMARGFRYLPEPLREH